MKNKRIKHKKIKHDSKTMKGLIKNVTNGIMINNEMIAKMIK